MATHAAAAPAPADTSKRGRKITIISGLTLLVMVAVALGAYIHLTRHDARSLFHGHRKSPAIRATRTVSAQLRRHLAWGDEEDMEDVLAVGDVGEEDGEDMEGPGVPEDGSATSTKKKKKKFSFDDELDGDEELAAEEDGNDDEEDGEVDEEDGEDEGDDGGEDDEDAGDEEGDGDDEEEPDDMAEGGTMTASKKGKKKRKSRVGDASGANGEKGAPKKKKKNKKKTATKKKKGGSSRGGRSSRMSNAGSVNQPLDGTKDPLIPTLDTRDNRRFADEVVLPDGHTVSIDVPSP